MDRVRVKSIVLREEAGIFLVYFFYSALKLYAMKNTYFMFC